MTNYSPALWRKRPQKMVAGSNVRTENMTRLKLNDYLDAPGDLLLCSRCDVEAFSRSEVEAFQLEAAAHTGDLERELARVGAE